MLISCCDHQPAFAMSVCIALLALAAGLHLCVGHEKEDEYFATLQTDLQTVQEELVGLQNDFRRKVERSASNMVEMKWDVVAGNNSKNVADLCKIGHSDVNQRKVENDITCGENLFFSSVPVPWLHVFQKWFDEKDDFEFGKGAKYPGAKVGHYTQMVWYKSYRFGCAVAKCPNKLPYLFVCQYCPAGNVLGPNLFKPYKIGEPCGDCPKNCKAGLCTNPCTVENILTNCNSLKKGFTCEHPLVKGNCPESCKCTTEIK